MKTLSEITKNIRHTALFDKAFFPNGIDKTEVSSVSQNSENAAPGGMFVCIKGSKADGHDFARKAYERGARIFVCEKPVAVPSDSILIVTDNSRTALAEISAVFFGNPEKELKIIGITGTKGKSTVAYMLAHILNKAGHKTGIIGTCGAVMGASVHPTDNTTPESLELFRILREMKDAGCEYVAVEVSSQAILLERIHGIRFFAAALTNLSPDHIGAGEHPNFENYKECKKALFSRCASAVLNRDDKYFGEFFSSANCPVLTYSSKENADICCENVRPGKKALGTDFIARLAEKSLPFSISLPGSFSAMNALCATALASVCGINPEFSSKALFDVSIPGRFETVNTHLDDVTFVIDYAHTGESLSCAIESLRAYCKGRIICVFGSVGGRTQMRRKDLGVASNLADYCIVTSDNPGTESPEKIISEIVCHVRIPYEAIPEREAAVKRAVSIAKSGDIVLFAGKGHEDYQLIGNKKVPLCERELILKYSNNLAKI